MKINLPDYLKIASQVLKNKVLVQDREVETALSWLQRSRAKFTLKSAPSQKGDWVEIEYSSPQIETLFKGLIIKDGSVQKREDAFVLGEGHLIPGFEEELERMADGQEKEFSLLFPENHFQKELAGKKIDFKVKMKSVQKMEPPELNDQFAQSLGNFTDLQSLKKSIRDGLSSEKEQEESQRIRREILEQICRKSEVELPEILISREQELMVEILKQDIPQKLGISFEDYLIKINRSEKELLESFLGEAKERVKKLLILRAISEREKIAVSEGEIKEEINKTIKHLPPEEEKKLDPEKLKVYTEEVIRNEKTLVRLENFARES